MPEENPVNQTYPVSEVDMLRAQNRFDQERLMIAADLAILKKDKMALAQVYAEARAKGIKVNA